MTVHFTDRPDPARADAGIALAATWDTGTPERRRQTLDAIRKAWESREWPHPGLLSYSVHAGEDGTTLLHYSLWTGEQAHQDFVRQGPDAREAGIDAAVPGIERLAPHTYELYRSGFRAEGDTREPGCVVIVEAEFAARTRPGNGTGWTPCSRRSARTPTPPPVASPRTSTSAPTAPGSSTTPNGRAPNTTSPHSPHPVRGSAPRHRCGNASRSTRA